MNDFRSKEINESEIDTILAEDIEFEGELEFHDPLLIKGNVKGEIRSTGDLYINPTAIVEAKIEANQVSLKGKVKGNVFAKQRLELFTNSELTGNIKTPDMIMQSGCRFNGKCEMNSTLEGNFDEE